ncbi:MULTISPECIES: AraC family transcriptional regulator [Burkholderia]|uniref:AraC family transcriptional regulator n=1 Tax=Burkholderia aenigmatica TaxID=2015348 RepID=A0A228INP6_9BURK|nr:MULTISPECIES: AraC family transcriptional regulator [Burkholderia]MBN3843273.1 AraC family transcriptional regulator [Burkholderia sp. Ac-20349]OXI43752.1 AraC family transcriptional regulator [Burkholderia aenigmatica]
MDPLSEVLSLLSTQSSFFGGLKAGGDWVVRFPAPDGIKFNAVVHGACWLAMKGAEHPIRLEAGDCFLVSRSGPVLIGSDLSSPAVDAEDLYRDAVNDIAHYGNAEDCFLIGSRFTFGGEADLLLDSLPAIIVVKSDSDQAAVLRWALQRLAHELASPSPGSALVTQHLGHLMLVQVLRIYLAGEGSGTPSWLAALAEPCISTAIQAIHTDPTKRWTVQALAQVAGVSRSTLALRFKQVAGLPPLEYVLRWRIHLATRSLRKDHLTISSIAQALGYESDSAFSSAFKRIMKCSPRDYRNRLATGT